MTENKAEEILKKVDESLKGLDKLNPKNIEKKSLSGLGDLKPDKNTGSSSTNTGSDQTAKNEKK